MMLAGQGNLRPNCTCSDNPMYLWGLGFRVQGLGLRVEGFILLGLRVPTIEPRLCPPGLPGYLK